MAQITSDLKPATLGAAVRRHTILGLSRQEWRNQRNGLLFVAPWLIGFLAFTFVPMASSLYFSFTSYNGLTAAHWVGLQNYGHILTTDPYIGTAVVNTLYLTALGVPLGTIAALGLALLLNQGVRGIGLYRTMYYLPSILPIVVSAFTFSIVLAPDDGPVNHLLALLHIPGPSWLYSADWSKPAMVLFGLWGLGNSMVIYLASLHDVPQHLIDAAEIDGAGWWARLRHVTLPMISPVIFFNVVLAVIASFQNFVAIFFLTSTAASGSSGGPAQSLLTWGLLIYNDAFVNGRLGYAAAMSWLMFIVVLFMTLLLFKIGSLFVYYEGGDDQR